MNKRLVVFLVLMSMHTSLLVTSTIAGAKFFALPFGLSASATVISYLLTFVILNVIAEICGKQHARFVINIGLVGMAVSAAYFQFAVLLPAVDPTEQRAFELVLSSSWRIWLGGWTAYLLSQNLDLWSFIWLRQMAPASLTVRAWVSILFGQLLDTVVFMTIAFLGKPSILLAIGGQYLAKIIFATVAAPLVSILVAVCRAFLGKDDSELLPTT